MYKTVLDSDFESINHRLGVYDIHSPRVPSVEEIVEKVLKMENYVPKQKLWINPDCGLKTRGEKETVESLKNLVEAAKIVRKD